ncbi:hypothetical protein GCM10009726_37270 [Nocardioides furvisabuli]|uniref:Uncharacterized protein n=1 Tax=Nocardioides furvisabuli TaxID=375542 RepID=A0ABP5JFB3_9ACTN
MSSETWAFFSRAPSPSTVRLDERNVPLAPVLVMFGFIRQGARASARLSVAAPTPAGAAVPAPGATADEPVGADATTNEATSSVAGSTTDRAAERTVRTER